MNTTPEIGGKSIVGRRSQNQDSFAALSIGNDVYLSIIADGVGGNKGGEIASSIVVKKLVNYIKTIQFNSETDLKEVVASAFKLAQRVIREKIAEEPDLNGMGTTLVCLLIYKNGCVWGNIGDSRLYIVSDTKCELATKDHSYVNQIIEQGNYENIKLLTEQFGHVITKVVNGGNDQPDFYPMNDELYRLTGNETFITCSDGLIIDKSNKENDWLTEIFNHSGSLAEFVDKLIEYAYINGSTDNISVSTINYRKFNKKNYSGSAHQGFKAKTKKIKSFLISMIILILVTISFLIGYLAGSRFSIFNNPELDSKSINTKSSTLKEVPISVKRSSETNSMLKKSDSISNSNNLLTQ